MAKRKRLTAEERKKINPAAFRLPYAPEFGEIVLYFQNGSRYEKPIAAVVVGPQEPTDDGKIDVCILRYMVRDIRSYPTVHHVDHPRLEKTPEFARNRGAWDFTPQAKRARELESDVAALKAAIAELQQPTTKSEV